MVFSTEHQLNLPNSFPSDEMVAFMATARRVLLTPSKSEAWSEFSGASNLIGWRFRSCSEDMERYIAFWKTFGANIPFEEMYLQERALFGMFTAGVSCIESTCYALHALASHPKLLALPFGEKEQRLCNPIRLQKNLLNHHSAHALAETLNVLINSNEWIQWTNLRNRMTHRSNLPRIIRGATGTDPPPMKALHFAATSSTSAFEADISNLEDMFTWLAVSLRNLLIEGTSFGNST